MVEKKLGLDFSYCECSIQLFRLDHLSQLSIMKPKVFGGCTPSHTMVQMVCSEDSVDKASEIPWVSTKQRSPQLSKNGTMRLCQNKLVSATNGLGYYVFGIKILWQ